MALVGDFVVRDRVNVDATDPVFTAAADAHDVFGNECLDLAQRADHAEFLLVVGRFGEHAEIEEAASAVVEVDDDEGVVENVGDSAVVDLVEVVDVLRTGGHHAHRAARHDLHHQVEEVAALLDERSASVLREAIPVANLLEEGEAVLADRDHLRDADGTRRNLVDQAGDRRHVPVLKADPGDRVPALGELEDRVAVVDGGAERLLDQHMEVGRQEVTQHIDVGEIR